MADQCIVCLENLGFLEPPLPAAGGGGSPDSLSVPASTTAVAEPTSSTESRRLADNHDNVAVIQVCGHTLHDSCLREWSGKANSCPICRQSFHLVRVYDNVGGEPPAPLPNSLPKADWGCLGTLLSSYEVEDKKQVAEFNPQAWLDENPEEEESTPCPVCSLADNEECLLLCDGCDTPYHTHCIGLDSVPHGSWFCMECADLVDPDVQAPIPRVSAGRAHGGNRRRNDFFPRTLASVRRARQRQRSDDWQGAWGQITGRVWDVLNIDLDYNDGDDALEEYRRSRQLREIEQREYQQWQQRLNIARRLGAQDVFAQNMPNGLMQQARDQLHPQTRTTPEETREERRAWGALDRARECDMASPGGRKRKSRSITAFFLARCLAVRSD